VGVDYYLARPDTGTVFELGRWIVVVDTIRVHVTTNDDEETLRFALRKAISGDVSALAIDPQLYADEIARRVTAFVDGHHVEVVSGTQLGDTYGDSYRNENDDLRRVGSVFTSDWGLP